MATGIKRVFDDIAESFGSATRQSIEELGSISLFLVKIFQAIPASLMKFHLIVEQMLKMGVQTISIIFLTSLFVGGVTAWQVQYLFADAIPLTYMGSAVGKSVLTELGPVFTALVITGRVGAKLAAELGTMKVTDQIDAMICLDLNPFSYLLAPRMIAGVFMVPMLTIFSSFFSIISAQLLAQTVLGLNVTDFYAGVRLTFRMQDVLICMVKAFVFGGGIALAGCYYGFLTTGGAIGVGESTNKAVVAASVLVLISNLLVVNILI
jgi:phospholipid/cholesterol/gamma-HCH transport system permease protein